MKLDIYYNNKKVGKMRSGKIYTQDRQLNFLLDFVKKKDPLILLNRGNKDILVYSDNPKAFYEFLMMSGYEFIEK